MPHFFLFIQERTGRVLYDPLLQLLPPRNLSPLTFTMIYSAIIVAIISFSFYPQVLLRALQSYCLLTVARVVCNWLVPLNDPPGLILLTDPFVDAIGYGGKIITKDLFFSGHTSTMFLLFLAAPNRPLKIFFLFITIGVATCLLIQHVHYTVDVVVAPVFAWFFYKICFSVKKI